MRHAMMLCLALSMPVISYAYKDIIKEDPDNAALSDLRYEKQLAKASACYELEEFKCAAEKYKELADEKTPPSTAAFTLSLMYKEGLGIKKDDRESIKYALKAAKLGHSLARLDMAKRFYYGHGVDQDAKVAQAIVKAVLKEDKTNQDAMFIDALINKREWGFEKLAKQGHLEATYELAMIQINTGVSAQLRSAAEEIRAEERVKQKNESGRLWMSKAAYAGHAKAQYRMAKLILSDNNQALMAAQAGETITSTQQRALKSAFDWAEKASEQKYADATFLLAKAYRMGIGGREKSEDKLISYIEKSCSQGLGTNVCNNIDTLKKELGGV